MGSINIKNGILSAYTKDYSIYQMYTEDAEEYYMAIANYDDNNFEMVIDFPEEYYESLLFEEKLEEIKNRCDSLFDRTKAYIYILPNIKGLRKIYFYPSSP